MRYKAGDKVEIDFSDVCADAKDQAILLNKEESAIISHVEEINGNIYYGLKDISRWLWAEYQLLDYIFDPIETRFEILDL